MDAKAAERQAAQRLVIGFHGTGLADDLRRMVERRGVGGVVFFARNVSSPDQLARVNEELIGRTLERPIFIAVDQEHGPVARLREGFTRFPAMGVLGAVDDPELTGRVARATAAELRAVGFNLDFAPVVDVNTNPDNPVIGVRAFGADPEQVSRHATAFVRALQDEGVIACAKHFPGHGDTHTDSHFALPAVDRSRADIEAVELVPFVQAAAAGVATVMTAHVMFPAFDPDWPATLSPVLLRDVLREQVGFRGVCITDDLEMKAISDGWGIPEAAVRSIGAGADLLLVCHDLEVAEQTIDAIARALVDREIDRVSFDQGSERIAALKKRYLSDYRPPVASALPSLLESGAHAELAEEVERRAGRLEGRVAGEPSGGGAADSGLDPGGFRA